MTSFTKADTEIILDDDIIFLEPAVFGNLTTFGFTLGDDVWGLSVTDDGRMFTVSHNSISDILTPRGPTEVTLIAWGSDGTVLWSYITTHFDRKYFDVTNDGSFVYVVGSREGDIIVEKIDFEGNQVWNSTIDMGHTETGYNIFVMEDETLIISGGRWDESPIYQEYFLLALNQTGHPKWEYQFDRYPSPQCESNYLYITTGSTLEKWDKSSSVLWSVDCSDERFCGLSDNVLYSVKQPVLYVEDPWPMLLHTEAEITARTSNTGEVMSSSNLKLCDIDYHSFNSSAIDIAVDQDGLVWILMVANDLQSSFLMSHNLTTESTSIYKVSENQSSLTDFEMDAIGNAFIAFTSETYGYTVMKFDSSQLKPSTSTSTSISGTQTVTNGFFELMDWQIVGLVIAGVVIFDIILILYFKRKATD